jgi:S-adenosylmethionine:tRNA ribosyltransferase-isomerase
VDFDYALPAELIAQTPAAHRDESRMLVIHRSSEKIEHRRLPELLRFLAPGDALVLNNSKVLPARLRGVKAGSGGQIEILLSEENAPNDWWVMLRPGKRVRCGTTINLLDGTGRPTQITAVAKAKDETGLCRLWFEGVADIKLALDQLGEVPLPPYIQRPRPDASVDDRERYQTVFAQVPGSVAAPTAGLHFTPELLAQIQEHGVRVCFVTLHVGLGTFAPVKAEQVERHRMHEEQFALSEETAAAIKAAKRDGGRVFAVGTTTLRALETAAARNAGELTRGTGRTRLFVYPPFEFTIVDALLTNFHLPRSTLLMLVSAFAAPGELRGRELVLSAYAEAIRQRYRFYSYGDAMLLL